MIKKLKKIRFTKGEGYYNFYKDKNRLSDHLFFKVTKGTNIVHWMDDWSYSDIYIGDSKIYNLKASFPTAYYLLKKTGQNRKEMNEAIKNLRQITENITNFDEKTFEKLKPFLDILQNGYYAIYLGKIDIYDEHTEPFKTKTDLKGIENDEMHAGLFMQTENTENLDSERVRHYKEKIKSGLKPSATILDLSLKGFNHNMKIVLDGHHKIKAYYLLKKPVNCIIIENLNENLFRESIWGWGVYLIIQNLRHLSKIWR